MLLTEDLIEQIKERAGPYLSDIKIASDWLNERAGREIGDVEAELESLIVEETKESRRTDLRIILSAINKIQN